MKRGRLKQIFLVVYCLAGGCYAVVGFHYAQVNNKPLCLLNVMVSGIYFHGALCRHDGVIAYPILLPRKYRR